MEIGPVVSMVCPGQIGPLMLGPGGRDGHILHTSYSSFNGYKNKLPVNPMNFDLFGSYSGSKGAQKQGHIFPMYGHNTMKYKYSDNQLKTARIMYCMEVIWRKMLSS